ncbi:MAG: sigma-54-dependent Fis family transcriptional regulator [Planctomycetes bacterium]|nr:sigma-54-dependent Fis family transcriptional regulator [Planctomycetota bacterium]
MGSSAKATKPERPRPSRDGSPPRADLIGGSTAMERARSLVARFADLDAPVLIDGETGTGKEVVARMLHAGSHRAAEPFVAVNCGALSDTLIESELFGHVKGAFTGASADHPGLFVSAGKGTIFLDEIVSMSPRLQASLLRALETGEVRPVGGTRSRRISARVVAATNRPLAAEVKRGAFRSDLFFRLERLVIDLPPLRDRAEDISALVDHFLRGDFAESGAVASAALLDDLRHRPWPGNVRELRNVIERMVLLSGSQAVLLPESPAANDATADPSPIMHTPNASAPSGAAGYPSRLDFLRAAFRERRRLTRGDAIRLLHCAPETAARALAQLETEKFVRRVSTSAHHRTSHFEIVAS